MNLIARLWKDYQLEKGQSNVMARTIQRQAFIAGCEAMRAEINMADPGTESLRVKLDRERLERAGQAQLSLVNVSEASDSKGWD